MIFFFGTRSSHLKSTMLDYETCPNCGQQNQIQCSVYGSYAHFFRIPLFPTGKSVHAQCRHCGAQWDVYCMTPEIRQAALRFRTEQRKPILHFTGLILFALFLGFLVFGAHVAGTNRQRFLADPQVNDCYVLRNSGDGYYTLARIEAIEGDTVWLSFNGYSAGRSTRLDKYNKDEYFGEDLYPFLKKELDFKGDEDGFLLHKIIRPKTYE
ncbi:MAG: hypothetical protein LBT76_05445 [Tannerella sp.]|nr:hypothetical protein [Tannerella sp.]